MMRVRAGAAVVLMLMITLTACGDGGGGAAPGNEQFNSADPVLKYGAGPVPDPATTYQPDVVLIEDGPRAIRAVSEDQFTWTLDAGAKGVPDLRPGKIMFATNQAVGRVMNLAPKGSEVAVTIAPVGLGEVVRDGTLSIDQEITADQMVFQHLAALEEMLARIEDPTEPSTQPDPGEPETTEPETRAPETTEPDTTEPETPEPQGFAKPRTLTLPTLRLQAIGPRKAIPWSFGEKIKVSIGNWDVEMFYKSGEVGINAQVGKEGKKVGLKGGVAFKISFDKPRVTASVPVQGGQVGNTSYSVTGFKQLSVDLSIGTENGVSDNTKFRTEMPIEMINAPHTVGGVPAVFKLKAKILVTVGLTMKQSTVSASGTMSLGDRLGFQGAVLLAPEAREAKKIVNTLSGATIGVSGVVFAVEFKFSWGFGISVVSVGPWVKVTGSWGVTLGSNADVTGVQCKMSTTVVTVGGGIGVDASKKGIEKLKELFRQLDWKKVESETQVLGKDVYGPKTDYDPDIPKCHV